MCVYQPALTPFRATRNRSVPARLLGSEFTGRRDVRKNSRNSLVKYAPLNSYYWDRKSLGGLLESRPRVLLSTKFFSEHVGRAAAEQKNPRRPPTIKNSSRHLSVRARDGNLCGHQKLPDDSERNLPKKLSNAQEVRHRQTTTFTPIIRSTSVLRIPFYNL